MKPPSARWGRTIFLSKCVKRCFIFRSKSTACRCSALACCWPCGPRPAQLLIVYLIRKQGFSADTKAYLPVLGALGLFVYALPSIVGEEQGLPIRGYGVMLLLAVSSAVSLLVYRGKRRGFEPEMMLSLAFWLFIAGIAGARLFYVIEYWEQQFHKDTVLETLKAVFNITQGGLVVFGSLIGGAVAALIYVRKHHLPTLVMGDLMAPCVVLGIAIGRIGCFLNGCCFGGVCELPWAVQFPFGSPPYIRQVEQGKLTLHGIRLAGGGDDPAMISAVEPGSLADKAGLMAGQQIHRVIASSENDQDVANGRPTASTRHKARCCELPAKAPSCGYRCLPKAMQGRRRWAGR